MKAFVELIASEHPLLVSDALVTLVRMAGSNLDAVIETAGVLAAATAAVRKEGQETAIVCNAMSLVQLLLAGGDGGGGGGGGGDDGGGCSSAGGDEDTVAKLFRVVPTICAAVDEQQLAREALVSLKTTGSKEVQEYAATVCKALGI